MSTVVAPPPVTPRLRRRATLLAVWALVAGAAPHVLHHVGPLVGTAFVAGAGGDATFAVVGFVAMVPTLRRLRRRTGSWRAPALASLAFAALFTFSSLVIGPAFSSEATVPVGTPEVVDHHGHVDEEVGRP